MNTLLRPLSVPLLLFLTGCSGGGEAPPDAATGGPDGSRIYLEAQCHTCHGNAGQGSALGPPLTGSASHWNTESLLEYFADPKGYAAADPRLSKGPKFPMPMPSVKRSEEDLRALAEYVLGL